MVSPGILRRRFRIVYQDGVQIEEVFVEEWVEQEPVNQVIGYGTRINTATIDTPEGPREYWRVVRMRATAYTAASSGKAPDHPTYGITASGVPAGTGVVAVDPNVVPFRSEVFVPGYGIGFVGDTGGGVKGRWIDLGYDEDELVAWNGYADVYYLTPIPAEINYLAAGSSALIFKVERLCCTPDNCSAAYNLEAKKSLGQNFLFDENVLERIVAAGRH